MSRILITASLLFYSFFFFGQNQSPSISIFHVKNDYFKRDLNDFLKPMFSFDTKLINTSNQLSVYNSFSKNNDNYILQQGEYYVLSPKFLLENNWRGNKIDSFNPYGAPNIGSALVLGFISVLFDKK